MSTIHHSTPKPQPLAELNDARAYLYALEAVCHEGSTSPDPRVTSLALALIARQGQELLQ